MSAELDDIDPIDEELVAYLDGEIDATGRARVEQRLAEDADYRDRLRRMQRTWDALDLLPRNNVGEAFTSSTMTLVVAEQQVEATQAVKQFKNQRGQRWLLVAAATLAAATISFALVYRRLTSADRELVNDLPIIEQVDQLHNTPSVEFISHLQQQGMFLADTNED